MEPQSQNSDLRRCRHLLAACVDHILLGEQDTLEDATQVAQVEDVVELGRCGQHACAHLSPQFDGCRRQFVDHGHARFAHISVREATFEHLPENVVDGLHRRQNGVETEVVALESGRDVVATTLRRLHARHIANVLEYAEVAALVLLQETETAILDNLSHELEGRLVAPHINLGHTHIVEKQHQLLARWGAKVLASTLLNLR